MEGDIEPEYCAVDRCGTVMGERPVYAPIVVRPGDAEGRTD